MPLKLKVSKTNILYVVEFELEDISLVKIGVTSRKIEDRVAEILVSIYQKYRIFPYAYPKRFRKVDDAFGKEKTLHKHFKESHYEPLHYFSGSTEFFDIPLRSAVNAYDNLLEGIPLVPKADES